MTAATKRQFTVIPKEYRKEVREGLRAARDIMNDDGLHWTKGEYKTTLIAPTGQKWPTGEPVMGPISGMFMFCAVGGVREVMRTTDLQYYTLVALIERGLPNAYYERYQAGLDNQRSYLDVDETDLHLSTKAEVAQDYIIDWNDRDETTWEDVSRAFTQAAKSVR